MLFPQKNIKRSKKVMKVNLVNTNGKKQCSDKDIDYYQGGLQLQIVVHSILS
jgi:hypothetical protein